MDKDSEQMVKRLDELAAGISELTLLDSEVAAVITAAFDVINNVQGGDPWISSLRETRRPIARWVGALAGNLQ